MRTIRHAMLLLPTALSGCAAPPSETPAPAASACVVVDDEPRAQLTLGVAGTAARHARARAEQLLSTQLFETLVRVDCTRAIVPGLAGSWASTDGRTWRFRLKPGATFHDGEPVTARTIVQAWSDASLPAFSAVTAAGDMDLTVTLVAAADAHVFADAAHAVKRRTPAGLVGTGLFRRDDRADILSIVSVSAMGAPRSITARVFAGDPRNAVDAGMDALVTGDPAVLAYARARSDYEMVPLPWSRTYVLASSGPGGGSRPSAAVLDALAHDAVRGEARAAQGPFWWEQCRTESAAWSGDAHTGDERAVVYLEGDIIARGLAERIVALAWPAERAPGWLQDLLPAADNRAPPSARGLDRDELTAAIHARTPLAVIAPLPLMSLAGCARLAMVTRDGTATLEDVMAMAAASWTVTPLLDSRDHLIHRPGLGRVTVDGSGIIRFAIDP